MEMLLVFEAENRSQTTTMLSVTVNNMSYVRQQINNGHSLTIHTQLNETSNNILFIDVQLLLLFNREMDFLLFILTV